MKTNELYRFIKLVRGGNLFLIVILMVLLQICLVYPFYQFISSSTGVDVSPVMSDFEFALLIISTVSIAAAGYIINDYFDVKIDEVNKPQRIIIDRGISRRKAILWHTFLNIIGVGIGFYLAAIIDLYPLALIQLSAFIMLWYYSTRFKKQFFIGNFVIGLLSALVVCSVLAYQLLFLPDLLLTFPIAVYNLLTYFGLYCFFSFWTTLIRELIKDMEDIEGDRIANCKTIPIVAGMQSAKSLAAAYILVLICVLVGCIVYFLSMAQYFPAAYIAFLIIIPLFALIWLLIEAESKIHFKRASMLTKLIIFAGVLSLLYFRNYFFYS